MITRGSLAAALLIGSATVAFGLNCFNGREACLREASETYVGCLRLAAERNQSGPDDAECRNNFERSEIYCNKC
jgi:hypothetical protein